MNRIELAGVGIVVAAAMVGGAFAFKANAISGRDGVVTESVSLPNVNLVDQFGRSFALRETLAKGERIIVNFNYTTCESICPVGNAVMDQVDEALAGSDESVRLLSITIDPRTDTQAVMAAAAREFEPSVRWLWLTGAPSEIDQLLGSLGAKVSDITLHTPLFVVGQADKDRLSIIRTMPEPEQLLAELAQY